MRDYAKLSPFFWTRGSGKKLRGNPDAQVVAMYLSTSPGANMIGLYHVTLATISHETGIPEKRARAALKVVADVGYAFFDEAAELAWVPNHAKFEIGDEMRPGDKRRARVLAELAQAKGHPFEQDFRGRYFAGYGIDPPTEDSRPQAASPFEGASADTEGASASGEQDRIRTGQDRTGQDREALPPTDPVTGVRSRRKPETPCPDADASPADLEAWATRWGIPPGSPELPNFLDHHRKKDSRWRDWAAAWRTWQRNAPIFAARAQAGPRRAERQPLLDPGSATWLKGAGEL